MMRLMIGNAIPFPSAQGPWIRTTFQDNNLVLAQVLMFMGNEVQEMNSGGAMTTPEVIRKGDELCRANKQVVVYTPITGIGLGKAPESLKKEVRENVEKQKKGRILLPPDISKD